MPNSQFMMTARDLEVIDRTLYEPNYEELVGRSLIPTKTDIPAGAETYTYNVMTRSGVAKILAAGADDLPLVDTDLKRETVDIYSVGVAFRYSVQELRAAQMNNMPVEATKALVARRAVAEKENKLIFIGDSKFNIKGLTNATGIQVQSVANGAGGTATWATKTPAEIIEDIRKVKALITVLPGYGSASLVLTLPADQYELIAGKRYSDFDARTILEVLRAYGWFTEIRRVADLKGAGTAGKDCFMIFVNSREVMEFLLPMDLTRYDAEWKFPNWKIPLEERTGGVVIRFPMAVAKGEGI